MVLEWFFALALWQQILILSIIFIFMNLIASFWLEAGPLASMSPLSGGAGFIAVFVIDVIIAVIGHIIGGNIGWYMATPLFGEIMFIIGVIVFAAAYQGFTAALARRLGFKDW